MEKGLFLNNVSVLYIKDWGFGYRTDFYVFTREKNPNFEVLIQERTKSKKYKQWFVYCMFYNLFYTRQTMRFHLQVPEQIQIRESQGFVKDIYDPASSVRTPLSEYRTMLDLIHRDGTLATCYDIITEFTTYRGFDFIRGVRRKGTS